jgi:hypothetical protein
MLGAFNAMLPVHASAGAVDPQADFGAAPRDLIKVVGPLEPNAHENVPPKGCNGAGHPVLNRESHGTKLAQRR